MNSTLDQLTQRIRAVEDLSSPSASKFKAVRGELAEATGLRSSRIHVKYLADAKNYGNRLTEALRHRPDLLLILLRDENADRLLGILRRRLTLSPETAVLLFASRANTNHWRPVGILGSARAPGTARLGAVFAGLSVLEWDETEPHRGGLSPEETEAIAEEMSGYLAGCALSQLEEESPRLVQSIAIKVGLQPHEVRVLVNMDRKNIENRVGEVLALFPRVLVVLTSRELAPRARVVIQNIGPCDATAVVVAVEDSDTGCSWRVWDDTVAMDEGKRRESIAGVEHDSGKSRLRRPNFGTGDEGQMKFKEVKLVEELVSHLPIDAHSQFLYEEHTKGQEEREPYKTKAFEYVVDLVADKNVSLIVLTGDAGHGKTHLCRRVLVHGGVADDEALDVLKSDLKGTRAIHLKEANRAVRVVKDLSEIQDLDEAASLLAEILGDATTVGIISANEGRLREVVGRSPETLGTILNALQQGLHCGSTTHDDVVHVVNLNYQAITPPEDGFLLHQLDQWAKDARRWRNCPSCTAHAHCPIAESREYLGSRDDAGDTRREGLVHLVRAAEQTGYVLTIRETLILLAYLITGGLTCREVHERVKARQLRPLDDLKLEQLLFETEVDLTDEQLGVLSRIRRFDPGFVPHRDIDEGIIEELESDDSLGSGVGLGEAQAGMTSGQLRGEARRLQVLVRSRRRRSFFEDPGTGMSGVTERSRRVGLYHYATFNHIQTDNEDPEAMQPVLQRIVDGLHVIQGIRPTNRSGLYVVDPAFSRSGSSTSVIAVRIPINELWLLGLHEYWKVQQDRKTPSLVRSVDWLDRQVVVCREEKKGTTRELITLDLLQFEFVMRAAEGVVFPAFHSADRRRILMRLARVAEAGSAQEKEIRFIDGDALRKIVIQRSGRIEVHGGD